MKVDIPESSGTPYVAAYSDNMTAAQLIDDGFGTSTDPLKSCPNVDQYPPEPLGATVVYTGYEDPNEQDLKMLSYVEPGLQGGNPDAAFATMNWSEAQYYGLQIASLENGGGAFVTPSGTTLDSGGQRRDDECGRLVGAQLRVPGSECVSHDVGDLCRGLRGRRDDADRHQHLRHAPTASRHQRLLVDGDASRGIRPPDPQPHPDCRSGHHAGRGGRGVRGRRPVRMPELVVLVVLFLVLFLRFSSSSSGSPSTSGNSASGGSVPTVSGAGSSVNGSRYVPNPSSSPAKGSGHQQVGRPRDARHSGERWIISSGWWRRRVSPEP